MEVFVFGDEFFLVFGVFFDVNKGSSFSKGFGFSLFSHKYFKVSLKL